MGGSTWPRRAACEVAIQQVGKAVLLVLPQSSMTSTLDLRPSP